MTISTCPETLPKCLRTPNRKCAEHFRFPWQTRAATKHTFCQLNTCDNCGTTKTQNSCNCATLDSSMTKRRSSWSGPKTEEWDFGPFIDEDNLFLDPEIDCHLDFQIQRASTKKGLFAGLGLWKEVKIPNVIECDVNNESPHEDEQNDDTPLLESKHSPIDMKSWRRCENDTNAPKECNKQSAYSMDREANDGFGNSCGSTSPYFHAATKIESKSEHRRMIPIDDPSAKRHLESKSEHPRSVPIEYPSTTSKRRLESKSEHRRMIPIDVDLDANDLACSTPRIGQDSQKKPQDSQRGDIPSTLEIDFERKLRFLAENKSAIEVESQVQALQLHHLSTIESDSVNVVQMWEMDPEDDDSFANEIDSMPLDMPPESPFPEDRVVSPKHDVLPRNSMRDDKSYPVAGRNALHELQRQQSVQSLECGGVNLASNLRSSDRSRHSVKTTEKTRRISKCDQGSEPSCLSRPESSLNRSSCHDRHDQGQSCGKHNPKVRNVQISTFRENHGSRAGMRDITYERPQQDRSPKSDRQSRTIRGARKSHAQESDINHEYNSQRSYQTDPSERRQQSGGSAIPLTSEGPRSPMVAKYSTRSSQVIHRQGPEQNPTSVTVSLDSVSSHRSRTGSSTHRSQPGVRLSQSPPGMRSLDAASYHRSVPNSTMLSSTSHHRSPPSHRGPNVDAPHGHRGNFEGENTTRRPRSSSVPKRTTVPSVYEPPTSVYSSAATNGRGSIYRKPLEDSRSSTGASVNPLLAGRSSPFNRQTRTGKEMSKKSYMDTVFGGLGSQSYHGVSSLSTPYKSAPAG